MMIEAQQIEAQRAWAREHLVTDLMLQLLQAQARIAELEAELAKGE